MLASTNDATSDTSNKLNAPFSPPGRVAAPLEAAAMAYAERLHWAVFPCVGKQPAIRGGHGCLDATTDPETITRWWREYPGANIGVATGAASGFWALDLDGDEGEDSLDELTRQCGPLPETVEALTGRGRHLLFEHPPGLGIRNRAGVRPGIDVRGDAGFIIIAPSIQPDTRRPYCWEVDHDPQDVPIAPAPAWLIELVRHRASLDFNVVAGEAPAWLERALGPVAEGQRNDTVARLAGCLLRRYVEPRLAYALLSSWNTVHCRPPLPEAELSRTFNSVLAIEMRRRDAR